MRDELLQTLKKLSILCVEDDEGIRKRLVNTLRYYFANVYEAGDGEVGYQIYKTKKPNIILTDILMPHCNGIELVENIRHYDKQTIIITLTAYSSEEYLLSLINLQINHYILKPMNSTKLFEAFEKALGDNFQSSLEICLGIFLDIHGHFLLYEDTKIALRKRECEFLHLLFTNKSNITSYELIEEMLWGGKTMSMSALKTFIKELRQKLPYDIIENIAGEGYRLKV